MNYIELINRFWALNKEYSFTPNEKAVYFALLNKCNELGWKNPFNQSNAYLSMDSGMSEPAMQRARNTLKQMMLIDFISGDGRRNNTKYSIIGVEKGTHKGKTKNDLYDSLSDTLSSSLSDTLYDENGFDNNKQINKTKLNQTKKKSPTGDKESPNFSSFEILEEKNLDKPPNCLEFTAENIVNQYNNLCFSLQRVKLLTKDRKDKINLRAEEMEKAGFNPHEIFLTIFEKMQHSDFCNGVNDKGWKIDFDFVVANEENWIKIYEGKYDNRQLHKKMDVWERTQRNLEDDLSYLQEEET